MAVDLRGSLIIGRFGNPKVLRFFLYTSVDVECFSTFSFN